MVSYFLNNAAKTGLHELKISENIKIEHVIQSKAFFHLSGNLQTSRFSAYGPGALNTAHNILIFSERESEHNEILRKVLQKCKKTRITLNLRKCLFCKTPLEIYIYFLKRGYETKS